MKVLFLDHDGVICLSNNWGGRYKKKGFDSNPETPMDIRMDSFDEKAVKVLNEIIELTGCEIVVSSDWKKHGTLDDMKEMYKTRGIKEPLDLTPFIKDCKNFVNEHEWMGMWELEHSRAVEIKEWLHVHPEVTHWVVVDDLNMGKDGSSWKLWGLDNFVHCKRPYNEGIKQSGIKEKILKFLK